MDVRLARELVHDAFTLILEAEEVLPPADDDDLWAPHPAARLFLRQARQYLAIGDRALAVSEDPRSDPLPPVAIERP